MCEDAGAGQAAAVPCCASALQRRCSLLCATIWFMDSEEFVRAVKTVCSDGQGEELIQSFRNPPGRRPSHRLMRLSKWFRQLDVNDQTMLREALTDAAESAVFGVLCVLDGVRAIESGSEKGTLALYYIKGDRKILLNDPKNEELHNVFQGMRSFD